MCHFIKLFASFYKNLFIFFENFLSQPIINMRDLNFKDLNLSSEESRDIIEFLARRRNVSNYERMTNEELLSTLKKKHHIYSRDHPNWENGKIIKF